MARGPGQRRTNVVVFGVQSVQRCFLFCAKQLRLAFKGNCENERGVRALDGVRESGDVRESDGDCVTSI